MFILMYQNTFAWTHRYWSEMRAWMALLMVAAKAVVMLAFMLNMYLSALPPIWLTAVSAASALSFPPRIGRDVFRHAIFGIIAS